MKSLKKNQIVIYVMALMLVTAGYLNYYANNKPTVETQANTEEIQRDDNNIGDASFVSSNDVTAENTTVQNVTTETNSGKDANTEESSGQNKNAETNTEQTTTQESNASSTVVVSKQNDNYFTTSKLERDKMYSQMLETYNKILENETVSEAQKSIATQEINKINNTKNAIMISENLLSIKGFNENAVLVNDESVNVVVRADNGLSKEQTAQIQNIISREMNAKIENIHIMNI